MSVGVVIGAGTRVRIGSGVESGVEAGDCSGLGAGSWVEVSAEVATESAVGSGVGVDAGVEVGSGSGVASGVGSGVGTGSGAGVGSGVGSGVGVDTEAVAIETVLASRVTAVWASALPLIVASVFSMIAVWLKIFPLNTELVPSVAWPPTCQNMFEACAPPLKTILVAELIERFCAICKIHTSSASPENVTSVGIVTPVLHLYSPGARVIPPILPAPNSVASWFVLPAASV